MEMAHVRKGDTVVEEAGKERGKKVRVARRSGEMLDRA